MKLLTLHTHTHVVSVPSQIPKSGTLWSLYMDFKNKRLLPWETIIPTFHYNSEQPFFEMLVPTTDTVRYGYLMEKLLSVRRSVLFTGGTGVGKVNFFLWGGVLFLLRPHIKFFQLSSPRKALSSCLLLKGGWQSM